MAKIRKSKWVEGVDPSGSISDVATLAVGDRLKLVSYYAPLAAEQAEESVEYVHQLRVCSRRAAAALKLFADLMPSRRARKVGKLLRHVRRAAGDARDLDVMLKRLADACGQDPAREKLLAWLDTRRQAAQAPIVSIYDQLAEAHYDRRVSKLVEKIRWRQPPPEPDYRTASRELLRPIVDEFFQAGEDLATYERLHQFRIDGKRLRYAMELLAAAFPDSFRKELYPHIEKLQQRLGKLNDHVTAGESLVQWAAEHEDNSVRDLCGCLASAEVAAAAQDERDFREWWTAERASELRRQFDALLRD